MTALWIFLLIWGVWILMPIIVDGTQIFIKLTVVLFNQVRQRKGLKPSLRGKQLPKVSLIIPAHNEEKVIERCLNSLKIQDYPQEKLELIVVDDGSTDNTKELVTNHINGLNGNGYINGGKSNGKPSHPTGWRGKKALNGGTKLKESLRANHQLKINGKIYDTSNFNGVIKLYTNGHRGKAYALNLGIKKAKGDLIMNIDSDVTLEPKAVKEMAQAFLRDKNLGAASGNVEIDGENYSEELNFLQSTLAKCQFLEFLNAFQIGKRYQALTNSIYTLSGAFSAFKKEVLHSSPLYQEDTVSEDTDLTFEIRKQKGVKIGYVAQATAFLHPSLTFDDVYAQRLRWHRGELEVCSKHRQMLGNKKYGFFGKIGLRETLLTDHTLAFTRLVWVLLLPFFVFFGYSFRIILGAILFMYLFYVALDFLVTFICWRFSGKETKEKIEEAFAHCFTLPLFRFFTFYPRMAGYLLTFKEKPVWRVEGPLNGFKNGINGIKNGVNGFKNGVKNGLRRENGANFEKAF